MTHDHRLRLAWVVAPTATLGSLWPSEVRGFIPCVMCWFQRVAMYPLALPLVAVGWLIALIHNLEDWGVIQTLGVCGVGQTTAGPPGATCPGRCGETVPWRA